MNDMVRRPEIDRHHAAIKNHGGPDPVWVSDHDVAACKERDGLSDSEN